MRDFRRLWPQALAVALVMSCGVATLIMASGANRSLDETRAAYYERHRFGDVFANATRAPRQILDDISAIPGVAAADGRIVQPVILRVDGMTAPAAGMAVSLPDHRQEILNTLYLRSGRMPNPDHPGEALISADFAAAHDFVIGARFNAVVKGTLRTITVVGVALSPEYVFAIGPGDIVPDDRRFGILWMSERELEALTDLDGAFNTLSVRLLRHARKAEVIEQIDRHLARFGGTGAYGREDQHSDAFLDNEIDEMKAMARIIPPIFLLVSAFLINMIMTRLIALEREQIGLLKALGYSSWDIAWHYLKLVVAISALGIAIGFAAGTWLGHHLTMLYAEFFTLPFLIFIRSPDVYAIAALVSIASAVAGALKSVVTAMRLPPAVAMQPPAPSTYRRSLAARLGITHILSQLSVMALRHVSHNPVRSALTTFGTALSVALLVVALFPVAAVNHMIDTIYFSSDRQFATITFAERLGPDAQQAAVRLPGVLRAEPFRSVPVKIWHGHLNRRLALVGKPPDAHLSRVLDHGLHPVTLPETGLAVSERVATLLEIERGDLVEVELLEGDRRTVSVPVTEIIQTYLGLSVYMNLDALDRLAGEGPRLTGVHIAADANQLDDLYAAITSTPALSSISLQHIARTKFRETVGRNIAISTTVYIALSVTIAFGVVYNSARIQLSEHARELASLRVLGFTRLEVSRVIMVQLALVVLLAQPLGWGLGLSMAWLVAKGFESDLMRLPLVIEQATYAKASLIVLGAAAVSTLIVLRRVFDLDLIGVLKTRE